jgi:hypothetical protein
MPQHAPARPGSCAPCRRDGNRETSPQRTSRRRRPTPVLPCPDKFLPSWKTFCGVRIRERQGAVKESGARPSSWLASRILRAAVTSPLIGADVCSRLVTTIRVLLAKTFEVPLRVREILHGSLTTVSRRIDLDPIQWPDIHSREAVQVLRDSIGKTNDFPRVIRGAIAEPAQHIVLDDAVSKSPGMRTKVGWSM